MSKELPFAVIDGFKEAVLNDWIQFAREQQQEGIGDATTVDDLTEFTLQYSSAAIDLMVKNHINYLWQRADDPEVVEAVQSAIDGPVLSWSTSDLRPGTAEEIVTALLTALLGPRPTEQENASER